ncbi:MAG: GspE/PulE family protein [Clostridiales bacterium]|jgi:type IV pilus assembly protein PilB|nr:GspE/PulE family protein [Clostridiales bacterium]
MRDLSIRALFAQVGLLDAQTERQMKTGWIDQKSGAGFLEAALAGRVSFSQAAALLEQYYGIPSGEIAADQVEADAIALLDYSFCLKGKLLPIQLRGRRLFTAMADPLNAQTVDDVFVRTGLRVDPMFAREEDVLRGIEQFYSTDHIQALASAFITQRETQQSAEADAPELDVRNAPAVALVDSLLEAAALYRASDIHIEPMEAYVRVRYRVDGHLKEFEKLDAALLPNLIGRLKILGKMDTAEKRLPQDGHFHKILNEMHIDFRVSTLPVLHGEKAVIRLIYNCGSWIRKEELGFFEEDLRKITRLFQSPYGAILLTGPTGCGKSTTLATFLQELNCEDVNIVTVEDPVEHNLPGVNQINVNPKAGLHFANALRSILRQDPDILMIGEIRDEETAKIAIQAAITGRLLLSTLHTYDALSAIARLTDMGVKDYLVAAAVKGILSQRLVRRICDRCKKPASLSPRQAKLLNVSETSTVFRGEGCSSCHESGYKGRFAVYEYLMVDETLAALIGRRAEVSAMKAALAAQGFRSLRENALRNMLAGHTTADEVIANALCLEND